MDEDPSGIAAMISDPTDLGEQGFADAYRRWSATATAGQALSPAMRALILVAVNASVTHQYAPALRRHIQEALAFGAPSTQVEEVLQLTAVLGIHSCSLGVAALLDEAQRTGLDNTFMTVPLTPKQEAVRAGFERDRGYWSPRWEALLRLDTDFFHKYAEFSAYPWRHGTLAPKEREFVYIAIDAATTHLYDPGLRIHVRNALGYGATMDEVMEVLKLTSLVGIQSCELGVAILREEEGTR